MEKDINATSAANDGKGYNEGTQETNQSDKDSSISNDEDRYSKGNRRKRNNNIQPDAIDIDEDKSSEKTSKEAAE